MVAGKRDFAVQHDIQQGDWEGLVVLGAFEMLGKAGSVEIALWIEMLSVMLLER